MRRRILTELTYYDDGFSGPREIVLCMANGQKIALDTNTQIDSTINNICLFINHAERANVSEVVGEDLDESEKKEIVSKIDQVLGIIGFFKTKMKK